jgi:hypothetical protein
LQLGACCLLLRLAMQFPFGLRLFCDLIVVDGSVMSFPDG